MTVGASTPVYTDIVSQTLTEINLLLQNFVFNGYHALSSAIQPWLAAIAGIYVALMGYAILIGAVRANMSYFMKAVLKIAFIYAAVTNWSFVSEYFINFINSLVGELGSALVGASPIHISGATNMSSAMQVTLIAFTKIGAILFDAGGITNIGALMGALVLWGFGYVMVGLALLEIILAKVMLAVLFIFTPLVVLLCYFKRFHPTFDRWLGSIVGFALLQLFVTATLGFALSLSYWYVAIHLSEQAMQIGNYGALPILIVGLICIGLILKAASLAQNLGGVVSSSSGSAMLGGMIGGAVGAGVAGMKSAVSGLKAAGSGAKAAGSAAKGLSSGVSSGVKAAGSAAKGLVSGISRGLRRSGE